MGWICALRLRLFGQRSHGLCDKQPRACKARALSLFGHEAARFPLVPFPFAIFPLASVVLGDFARRGCFAFGAANHFTPGSGGGSGFFQGFSPVSHLGLLSVHLPVPLPSHSSPIGCSPSSGHSIDCRLGVFSQDDPPSRVDASGCGRQKLRAQRVAAAAEPGVGELPIDLPIGERGVGKVAAEPGVGKLASDDLGNDLAISPAGQGGPPVDSLGCNDLHHKIVPHGQTRAKRSLRSILNVFIRTFLGGRHFGVGSSGFDRSGGSAMDPKDGVVSAYANSVGKMILDRVVALGLLVSLAPVLGILAIMTRRRMGKPAFFRQLRWGLGGRCFVLVKLRSMQLSMGPEVAAGSADDPSLPLQQAATQPKSSLSGAEDSPSCLASTQLHQDGLCAGGPRLTAYGRFLRQWSLDELPSLWNVVRGDLSLVGPRPLMSTFYHPQWRGLVRPGMTGLAQVRGRNHLSWRQKFRYDMFYMRKASLALDLYILWKTLPFVVSGEGTNLASAQDFMPKPGDNPALKDSLF
jgi:lipopolysaccharide/colanic/teichoic acid biosynthesis glycosyltransferase